jgi:hypothetical protein
MFKFFKAKSAIYDRVGGVVRKYSEVAAIKCMDVTVAATSPPQFIENPDFGRVEPRFVLFATEFLAFFSTVAVNEIGTSVASEQKESVDSIFRKLHKAILVGKESNDNRRPFQFLALTIMSQPRFDPTFHAYWNGDLETISITQAHIVGFEERGLRKPSGGPTENAWYALIARICLWENPNSEIPPTATVHAYETAVTEQANAFLSELRTSLK